MSGYHIVSYLGASGPRAGIVVDESVLDVASLTERPAYTSVLDVLNDWGKAKNLIAGAMSKTRGTPAQRLSKAELVAPVLYPSSICCAGANYSDHQQEIERLQNLPHEPDPHTLGLSPWHFLKASRSITGPNAAIKVPPYSKMLDWEAELVAVIGKPAKDVPVERALEHVAGYTIANDLSARDAMKRPGVSSSSPFQFDWIAQKCFDQACPVGPWITPAEQVGDPQALGIKLWVNDALKQDFAHQPDDLQHG